MENFENINRHALEIAIRSILRAKLGKTEPSRIVEKPLRLDGETVRWHLRNALKNLKERR